MSNFAYGSSNPYATRFDGLGYNERFDILYGDLSSADTTQPQDRVPSENRTLPFAAHYKARNRRIEMVLLRLLQEEDMFPCRVLLPMAEIATGQNIIMTLLKFEPMSMDPLPQEGVVQNVSTSYSTSTYQARSFGAGFMIQDSMLHTEVGFLIYSGAIMQIETAIKTQLCVTAYNAILSANQINDRNHTATAYEILSVNQSQGIQALIEAEIFFWSILTKTPHGFRELKRRGENTFSRRQIQADTMVMPHNTATFLEGSRPELNDYSKRGPDISSNNLSYTGYIGTSGRIGVYETGLYKVEEKPEPIDPTERERVIGEFFDSRVDRYLETKKDEYRSQLRSLTFMNEATKQLETVRISAMLDNSGLFKTTDDTPSAIGKKIFGAKPDGKDCATIDDYLKTMDTSLQSQIRNAMGSDDVERDRNLAKPLQKDTFTNFIRDNVPVPVNFRLARPSMRYLTTSGFMMQKGAKTGNTFYGDPQFVLTYDGTRRVLHGSHNCVIGAKVYDAEKVFLFPNVFVGPIISGGNFIFFDPENTDHTNGWSSGDNDKRSLFSIPMRPDESYSGGAYMDMTGNFPDHSSGMDSGSQLPHFKVYEEFNAKFQFMNSQDNYIKINFFAGANMITQNTLCCQGSYIVPKTINNGAIRERGELIQGRGHWGPSIYNGVCEDRSGIKGAGVAPLKDKLSELLNTF